MKQGIKFCKILQPILQGFELFTSVGFIFQYFTSTKLYSLVGPCCELFSRSILQTLCKSILQSRKIHTNRLRNAAVCYTEPVCRSQIFKPVFAILLQALWHYLPLHSGNYNRLSFHFIYLPSLLTEVFGVILFLS